MSTLFTIDTRSDLRSSVLNRMRDTHFIRVRIGWRLARIFIFSIQEIRKPSFKFKVHRPSIRSQRYSLKANRASSRSVSKISFLFSSESVSCYVKILLVKVLQNKKPIPIIHSFLTIQFNRRSCTRIRWGEFRTQTTSNPKINSQTRCWYQGPFNDIEYIGILFYINLVVHHAKLSVLSSLSIIRFHTVSILVYVSILLQTFRSL